MRKRTIIVTAVPLFIAGTVASYAFVSQTFSADNSTTTGKTATAASVTGTVTGVPSDFAPNDTATIKLHVVNPNRFPVRVNATSFTVSALAGCPTDSFTIDHVSGPADVPAATSAGSIVTNGESDAVTASLHFNLTGGNQNACLGQPLTVTASAS